MRIVPQAEANELYLPVLAATEPYSLSDLSQSRAHTGIYCARPALHGGMMKARLKIDFSFHL